MSNIKITIDGVEKEYESKLNQRYDVNTDLLLLGKWYKEAEPAKLGYEILSFGNTTYGGFCNKIENGVYKWDKYGYEYNLEFMLDPKRSFTIHSVKRLSDGVVFTVGEDEKSIGEIKEIWIDNDGDVTFAYDLHIITLLEYAEKVKQPTILLTTEDGKAVISLEEELYYVNSFWSIGKTYGRFCVNDIDRHEENAATWVKYFSTEAARDEYILYNKPITVTLKEFLDSDLSDVEFFKSKQK